MVAASRASQNLVSSALPSSLARCASPRVHAKMEATGFVLVVFPFWCCLQCLVTVPAHVAARVKDTHTDKCLNTAGASASSARVVPDYHLLVKCNLLYDRSEANVPQKIETCTRDMHHRACETCQASSRRTMRSFALNGLAVGGDEHRCHEAQRAVTLSNDVTLHRQQIRSRLSSYM